MIRKLPCYILGISLSIVLLAFFACAPASVNDTASESAPKQAESSVEPVQAESTVSEESETTESTADFSVASAGIVDGVMADAFGMRGTQLNGYVPTRSLPLRIENAPDGASCLALSMIDPDGGDWVHWLAINIPVGDLAENASIDLAGSFVQGLNDFQTVGYGGPTPPSGVHTYVITVYALSETVPLEEGFTLEDFTQAIDGKVLESAELTGTYSS